MSWHYGGWRPYVSVSQRRAKASAFAAKLAKKEKRTLAPIELNGRKIATSFWGQAWCDNLESYSDFANRLPRGRTYVRNGSVIDLQIERGKVKALVSGSDIYKVAIDIKTLPSTAWGRIKQDCARSISSLIDLLRGRFERGIMERLTERGGGLFPQPSEIEMKCSCPDWATMCKHVAATLYGVGARLDAAPELLFTLRDVDHLDLISQAVDAENLNQTLQGDAASTLAGSDLGAIFGIDLDEGNRTGSAGGQTQVVTSTTAPARAAPRPRAAKKPPAANKTAKKTRPTIRAKGKAQPVSGLAKRQKQPVTKRPARVPK
jgi:uncharacterized Zn finger protein